MTPYEYVQSAMRTCSDNFYHERVDIRKFLSILTSGVFEAHRADTLKRVLFYGKPGDHNTEVEVPIAVNFPGPELVHGVLGIFTEAGELLELLKNRLQTGKLDQDEMIEELGDLFWYTALLCEALEIDMEDVWERNIEKLQARYPEKFTEELALNRD